MYHATKSRNMAGIGPAGLDPNFGGTGAAQGDTGFEERSANKVHYTRKGALAADYKNYFEGAQPFGANRKDPAPESAEVLQIALPRTIVETEQDDADSKRGDRAYTTTQAIPPENIRRVDRPAPVPAKPAEGGENRLTPGENAEAFRQHVLRATAESASLESNLPPDAVAILNATAKQIEVQSPNINREQAKADVLTMIRNALASMPASDILDLGPPDWLLNPRATTPAETATGQVIESPESQALNLRTFRERLGRRRAKNLRIT